jgi:hypothetical protein
MQLPSAAELAEAAEAAAFSAALSEPLRAGGDGLASFLALLRPTEAPPQHHCHVTMTAATPAPQSAAFCFTGPPPRALRRRLRTLLHAAAAAAAADDAPEARFVATVVRRIPLASGAAAAEVRGYCVAADRCIRIPQAINAWSLSYDCDTGEELPPEAGVRYL